jgi:hypothetical protein
MGKKPRPTEEELEFVYNLICRGLENADIKSEMGDKEFPRRDDRRYFYQRRREFNAAKRVLEAPLSAGQGSFQEAHLRRLVYFGQLFRDKLFPARDVVRRPAHQDYSRLLWLGNSSPDAEEQNVEAKDVKKHWGWSQYDAQSHPLFVVFHNHLGNEHQCWSILSDLQAAYQSFCTGCKQARTRTFQELENGWSEFGAQITENAVTEVAVDAFSRVRRPGLVESAPLELIVEGDGETWRLTKGQTIMASSSRRDSLDRLKERVATVDRALPSTEEFNHLPTTYQRVQVLTTEFKQLLMPDDRIQSLVVRGRCEFCSSSLTRSER